MKKQRPRDPRETGIESLLGADTTAEFALRARISVPLLYKLWREGKGPPNYKLGKRRYIPRRAGQKWIESLAEPSMPPKPDEHRERLAVAFDSHKRV